MINSDFKKKMADNWFSYLQSQICKEFEIFEKGKKNLLEETGIKKIRMKEVEHLFYYQREIYLKKLELINQPFREHFQKNLEAKY